MLEGLDAIAVDLPGFGATPAPPAAWGLEQYADAVRPVLEEMDQPVVILGHSFGGSVGVHLAASGPAAARGLVVTGSPLIRQQKGTKPPMSFRLARWLNGRGLFPNSKMEELRNSRGSADYRAATGVMRDTLVRVVNQDAAALLPKLQVPIELVWGEEDREVSVQIAVAAAGMAPHARLTRLPGTGHDTPLEAPNALRAALLRLGADAVEDKERA